MASPTTDRRLGLAGNTAYKTPVTCAALVNIALSGEQTVGGVAVKAVNAAGVPDRVLVTAQTNATQNGIWDVSTAAWTRSIDSNGNYDLVQGTQVVVTQGASAGQSWALQTANPITIGTTALVFTASLTSAVLATLADRTSAVLGAGLVGENQVLNYAVGTVGYYLRNVGAARALASFGLLNNDGATDDAATFQAAAASGVRVIDARGLNCKVNTQINIPSNQIWLLEGTNLVMASAAQYVFAMTTVNNWALLGPFTVTGDGSTVGTARGISISDCQNWYIDRPIIQTIRGYGIYISPGASSSLNSQHGTINCPRIDSCYFGHNDDAGTGAEYCTIINAHITRCTVFNISTAAGNLVWLGGHCLYGVLDGMLVTNGANQAHGIVSAMNINHNTRYNLNTQQVLNGQTFDGCHFYALDALGSGAVWFDRSKGISLLGGHLDCQVYNYKDGSSGMNVIEGAYCPGTYGVSRKPGSNNGHDQLIMRGLWGPGAYAIAGGNDATGVTVNDPSTCYVIAQRDAGTTQALVSGVAATLTWTANPFPDRRAAGVLATGVFTAPADQAGLYHIDLDCLFGGTAMSAIASFIEIKVNGATKKICLASIFGTTKLQVQDSFDIYLNASDALTFVATITGTTPTFGDATWPSNMALQRKA